MGRLEGTGKPAGWRIWLADFWRSEMSRLRSASGAVTIALLALTLPAYSSQEGTIESTQPIVTENFIRPCTVTYIWSGMVHIVGSAVAKTCSPDHVKTDMGVENRNAANRAGLTVAVASSDSSWHPLFGDTLRVTLNVTSIGEEEQIKQIGSMFSTAGLVEATVQCIRENAERGVPAARHLDLRVVGSKRYAKFSRVYAVASASREGDVLLNDGVVP